MEDERRPRRVFTARHTQRKEGKCIKQEQPARLTWVWVREGGNERPIVSNSSGPSFLTGLAAPVTAQSTVAPVELENLTRTGGSRTNRRTPPSSEAAEAAEDSPGKEEDGLSAIMRPSFRRQMHRTAGAREKVAFSLFLLSPTRVQFSQAKNFMKSRPPRETFIKIGASSVPRQQACDFAI